MQTITFYPDVYLTSVMTSFGFLYLSLIYTIGYFGLNQPELFRIPLKNNLSIKRLNDQEIKGLDNQMVDLIKSEKLYLDKNLTLAEFSERLNTSTNNLSWYLNNIHGCTFYDYINKLRIEEFLHRLESGDHIKQTILSLSIEVGFNSKSTFNKAFKVVMNDTPSSYIKNYTTP